MFRGKFWVFLLIVLLYICLYLMLFLKDLFWFKGVDLLFVVNNGGDLCIKKFGVKNFINLLKLLDKLCKNDLFEVIGFFFFCNKLYKINS